MKYSNDLGLIVFLLILGGCGSTNKGLSEEIVPLIGPDATVGEAAVAYRDLRNQVLAIDGFTLTANLPDSPASYTGIIGGGPSVFGPGGVSYIGNLLLTTDFSGTGVSGQITNIATDVSDFENPTGSVEVTGGVSDNAGEARINFSGTGTLVGDGVEAELDLLSASGRFVGSDGAGLTGTHATDVNWTVGPRVGFDQKSDGWFYAEQD